jgi:hypothetical protein
MFGYTITTMLKLFAACPLVLAIATCTRAAQPSAVPEGGAAVTSPQSAQARATAHQGRPGWGIPTGDQAGRGGVATTRLPPVASHVGTGTARQSFSRHFAANVGP